MNKKIEIHKLGSMESKQKLKSIVKSEANTRKMEKKGHSSTENDIK